MIRREQTMAPTGFAVPRRDECFVCVRQSVPGNPLRVIQSGKNTDAGWRPREILHPGAMSQNIRSFMALNRITHGCMTLSSVLESPITERPFDSTVLDVKPRDSVYASLAAVLRSTHPVEYHRTPAGEAILTAGCAVERRIFPGQSEAWEMGFLKETASLLSLRKRGGLSFSIFFDPGHGQHSWNCFAPIHISIPRCAPASSRFVRIPDRLAVRL